MDSPDESQSTAERSHDDSTRKMSLDVIDPFSGSERNYNLQQLRPATTAQGILSQVKSNRNVRIFNREFSDHQPQISPQHNSVMSKEPPLIPEGFASMTCNQKYLQCNSSTTTYQDPNGSPHCRAAYSSGVQGASERASIITWPCSSQSSAHLSAVEEEINTPGPSIRLTSAERAIYEDKVNKTTPKKCRESKITSQQKNEKLLSEESDSDDSDKEYSSENKTSKTAKKTTRKTGKASGGKHHVLSEEEKRRRSNEASKNYRLKRKIEMEEMKKYYNDLKKRNNGLLELLQRLKDAKDEVTAILVALLLNQLNSVKQNEEKQNKSLR